MRAWLPIRVVGCLLAVLLTPANAAPVPAGTLTIATYNLQNYGLADRLTDAGFRTDYPKPEDQKRALRRVIVDLNADILAVQEIGGEPYLEELRRDLRGEGLDYPHAVLVRGADAARRIALLSKHPVTSFAEHINLTFPYFGGSETVKRGLLEAHFDTAAGDLAVFVVHLKSRFSDRADDPRSDRRRLGEALAVRDLIWRRSPPALQAQFVLLGDFNDERNSAAIQRLTHRGHTVLMHLVPVADPRGDTWTHAYRKQDSYSRVDHVFVSPRLKSTVDHGRGRIHDGPGVRKASDHRPVIVTLRLDGVKK